MRTLGNDQDGFANLAAILGDGLVFGEIAHGDFVAQGNIVTQFDTAGGFAFQGDHTGGGALFQVGNRDADIIVDFVE
jgi:hypothetical protein